MKKAKKIWLITAVLLTVTGLLIAFMGFAAIGFDYEKLNMSRAVTNTYTVSEEFTDIAVESCLCDVRFAVSDDGLCKVVCLETDKISNSVTVENGTLTVRENDKRRWYEHIGVFWGDMETVIYLPETEYQSLRIEGSVCDVEAPKAFSFDNVQISVSTGDVDFYASVKTMLSVKADTGDIEINGTEPEKLEIKTSTGEIEISSVKVADKLSLKTDTGEVELTDIECKEITAESSTGNITLNNTIASGDMWIESDTGNVKLSGCDASALYIKTDTGDVFGRLLSDKVFITETDTGNVNVPKTVNGGRCEIETDTGNIRFE